MQEALDAGQNSGDVVRWAPTVLQNVEAELSIRVYIWVEHPRQEFDSWRFVRVALIEGEEKFESAIFEWCFSYA